MAESKVTCRKPKGKNTYVLAYRHPVVKDASGYGRKIQRGAGTGDDEAAHKLAAQLEELINDEKWHNLSRKNEAYGKFDRIVVDAFYDCMPDLVELRTVLDRIPLPTVLEGYVNTSIVGPSGAGKTTILRNRLGTADYRFPTTSSNRTTTCDTEYIISKDKTYKMVVQITGRNELEAVLFDNVCDCIEYVMRNTEGFIDDIELLITLLNHREMETRLSYTLGMPRVNQEDDVEEDDEDENEDTDFSEDLLPEMEVNEDEQDRLLWHLEKRIKDIALRYRGSGRTFDEIEGEVAGDEEVLELIDDIVSALISKFGMLNFGSKTNPKAVWPDGWYFETNDEETFIRQAKVFVGNDHRAWGRLLTPLVKAIRIQGPFIAEGADKIEEAVYSDGIGFGHATKSAAIPTSVMDRCVAADIILLVDGASNPLMENTKMALKSLIEHGFADRIIFGFTKMDLVTGANYRNSADKKDSIKRLVQSYLLELRKQENVVLSDTEVNEILKHCTFFSRLDRTELSKVSIRGFSELKTITDEIVRQKISTEDVHFEYEALKLYYYLKESTLKFRKVWAERTGYSSITNNTERWSRIRALARRLGLLGQESYSDLQPLADYAAFVQENINTFINMPDTVVPEQASEYVTDELKRRIKRLLSVRFRELNKKRMWTDDDPISGWKHAYDESGRGSRNRRARIIENIFDEAAPYLADIPNMTEEQKEYLAEVVEMVEKVLNEYGCKLLKFSL